MVETEHGVGGETFENLIAEGLADIGLKETHESFRKVPNSFDKIITNIKKLQKVPSIKVVQVTTVANKKNLKELESLYKLMLDLNVKYWRVVNVDPIGRAKDNKDILLEIYLRKKEKKI